MVVVSYSGKEINAKLVYYGAGLSGKTTNLESIYEAVPDTSRGKMVSMKTQSDRTLFFDLLPLDLGEIMGFKTRFLLYTVPGQVFYNATRKLVLKGADAIVLVADSEKGKMEENKESLANLRANLSEYGLKLEDIPFVLQYNKRDLPEIYTVEELNAELNPDGKIPVFEAVATEGKGVFETFRGISHILMEKVTKELRRSPMPRPLSRPAPSASSPSPASPPASSPAPVTESLGQSIMREAQSSPPAPASPQPAAGGFEYGRELSLPGEGASKSAQPPSSKSIPTMPDLEPGLAPGLQPVSGPSIAVSRGEEPAPGAQASDAASAENEITIPVRIPRGQKQVVVRIVITPSE